MRFIRLLESSLTGTTHQSRSGLGRNGNERVLQISQIARTESLPQYVVYGHNQDSLF